jgi:4-hydroxy-2-oxoglutarate aldolase
MEEAEAVVRTVRQAAAPGKVVLAGTGQLSTRATIEMTKCAAGAGCDAVLVVTPYYFKGLMTEDALFAHFVALADASPVPVFIYNVPANTGLNVPAATVARIGEHPNVAGVKDSSGDIGQLAEILRLRPKGKPFSVLSGNFGSALPGYVLGAHGAILAAANIAPAECVAMRESLLSGRIGDARDLHLKTLPAARAVTSQMGVPGLKAALTMQGHPVGEPRGPLMPLSPEKREELREILVGAGLLP